MIRLWALGRIELTDSQGLEVPGILGQPKLAGLLAFLACCSRGTFSRRASLLPLFWPESTESSARHSLSQTLYRLRQAAGTQIVETRGEEDIRLAPELIAADVTAFNDAIEEQRWFDALTLYGGELLPGFAVPGAEGFERWLEEERLRLRRRAASAAWSAAEAGLSANQLDIAAIAARRGVELDPLNEKALLQVMRGLHTKGNTAEALSLFEELGVRLRRDYAVQPRPDTEALARSLLATRGTSRAEEPHEAVMLEPSRPASSRVRLARAVPRPRLRSLAVAVVALAAIGAFVARRLPATAPQVKTVAVLPLVDRSVTPADVYLVEGLYSAFIGELAQSAGLQVLPRTSILFRGGQDASDAVGSLDVSADAVVKTELIQIRDSVQLHVELFTGRPSTVAWTGNYARDRRGIPALSAELATAVVRALQAENDSRHEKRLQVARALSPSAFDAWLLAAYHASRRRREDMYACIENADRAVSTAPTFAEAHLLSARCNNVLAFVDTIAPDSAFSRAKQSAMRAIALDPKLATAHAELAYAVAHFDWQWARAESLYHVALSIDDRQSQIHADFAWLLATRGRFDEAMAHARRAELLAPGSAQTLLRTGMILHLARRHDAALLKAQQAISIDSTFMFAWDRLHWAYHGLNRPRDALYAAKRAAELAGPADLRRQGFLANAYARAGDSVSARAIVNTLIALSRRVYVPPNAIAAGLVALGDFSGALDKLETANAHRDGDQILLQTFPLWDPLRDSPRFQTIVRQMQLPEHAARR